MNPTGVSIENHAPAEFSDGRQRLDERRHEQAENQMLDCAPPYSRPLVRIIGSFRDFPQQANSSDAEAGKWRMLVAEHAGKFRSSMWESDAWDHGSGYDSGSRTIPGEQREVVGFGG